ncbi:MAG: iron-only hydrogenase system regulator [Lachnospiraceae bacterium]|nr:iron-only hydrogenase system regulator [Lachnospiraceae bacterium]
MKKIAVLSIIIEKATDENVLKINEILHEFREYVLGRMGLPDKVHGVNLISVSLFATMDTLNAITGKLGNVSSVSAKILVSNKDYE